MEVHAGARRDVRSPLGNLVADDLNSLSRGQSPGYCLRIASACWSRAALAAAITRPSEWRVSGRPSQSHITPPAPSTTGTNAMKSNDLSEDSTTRSEERRVGKECRSRLPP